MKTQKLKVRETLGKPCWSKEGKWSARWLRAGHASLQERRGSWARAGLSADWHAVPGRRMTTPFWVPAPVDLPVLKVGASVPSFTISKMGNTEPTPVNWEMKMDSSDDRNYVKWYLYTYNVDD